MSNKVKSIAKQVEVPEQKTKSMNVRIDVEIAGHGVKSTYIVITGIPEDLPPEFESTVIRTAESQFAQALNQRLFLEFYSQGKTSADEQPVFFNLSKVEWLEIKEVKKVDTN